MSTVWIVTATRFHGDDEVPTVRFQHAFTDRAEAREVRNYGLANLAWFMWEIDTVQVDNTEYANYLIDKLVESEAEEEEEEEEQEDTKTYSIVRLYRDHAEEVLDTRLFATPNDVLCVLDDRDRVVQMWRRRGFRVLQVANGDF